MLDALSGCHTMKVVVKRTSLNLEFELVAQAREVLGTTGTTETIHRALAEVVRRRRLRELADERFEDLTPEALGRLRSTRS
jgi:Arc/MetJ family transcription regulator